MPKTAGDATCSMLCAVPGLVVLSDPLDSNEKHATFWEREDEVGGKLLAMNIRRLPAWALSAAHHRAAHGLHDDPGPQPLASADEMAESTDPDDMMRWMTDGVRFPVAVWLRAEHLEEDVLGLLERLGARSPEAEAAVRGVGRVNTQIYERDLDRWFTAAQLRRMYERNPGWTAVERAAYGDTLLRGSGRAARPAARDRGSRARRRSDGS
jgi:hypothetical protein